MSLETDLNRRYVDRWLEDMRERFMKEVRFDVGTGNSSGLPFPVACSPFIPVPCKS